MRRGRQVHVLPQGTALGTRDPALKIDFHAAHLAQVNDKGTVGDRMARDGVPTAANRDRESRAACGLHSRNDVGGRPALDDRGGSPVDRPVERHASRVVAVMIRPDHRSSDPIEAN